MVSVTSRAHELLAFSYQAAAAVLTKLGEADLAGGGLGEPVVGLAGAVLLGGEPPTNVAIHQVNTAMELGDVQIALDLGPALDTTGLPTERRVRHALELARAYSARNRREDGLAVLLDAERIAPEQVRHHFISRQLVLTWMRQLRRKPDLELAGLAARLGLT
jgi:hypothetical protein